MIEINRRDSRYTFRINPYAPTEIDVKENKHRARWRFLKRCATGEDAIKEILRLEADGDDDV